MDKNNLMMTDSTPPNMPVPVGEKKIHRRYGLRITHRQRTSLIRPRTELRPHRFDFFSLCHMYAGHGRCWMEGVPMEEYRPGDGILVAPGVIHDYCTSRDVGEEDFVCFAGPVADYLLDAGVLKSGVLRIGGTRRLVPVIEQAMDPSDDAQIAANSMLQKLLVDLYLENRTPVLEGSEKVVADLRARLVSEVHAWWTVEEMAQHCHMSINHFRALFRRQTGMTPKAYVERLKMSHAAERLCHSNEPVGAIAATFSYRDPYHFSRAFKRVMGQSPLRYRMTRR